MRVRGKGLSHFEHCLKGWEGRRMIQHRYVRGRNWKSGVGMLFRRRNGILKVGGLLLGFEGRKGHGLVIEWRAVETCSWVGFGASIFWGEASDGT